MTKLNENLPLGPREMRNTLNNNFHLINEEYDFVNKKELEKLVKQYAGEEINKYNEKIQYQIQHIIVPPTNHINTKEVKKYGL
ncbi:hypothetical protein [Melissococcus plutonius]|uniref:Uncharacterized protein n=1 Tax=Melissococcus plutonius (strain ATCC 35311 / DSM 29964 / CIP 104052 / LMG 20360 / NCIMB 702443) TaxID=940190 RepID=F3YBF2_MELPT|nr:hypothetical protein [Melissococcus plutonius]KMT33325.1 hypothetical protein MEPL6_1c03640 [Melissococcus plutonius]KMT33678.1 hypothetical protein MEPL8_7c01170 [Melissococcus plutonius]KMT38960.1 hypothetical protein MEPL12_5c00640 [Melissococcus plutonius]MBB5177571.1 hypothetical protein [Melissococcus plutonius]BAK21830.1 hypothetical protein MPTP_1401 [Melissococcus plutonius ATCC 35311]